MANEFVHCQFMRNLVANIHTARSKFRAEVLSTHSCNTFYLICKGTLRHGRSYTPCLQRMSRTTMMSSSDQWASLQSLRLIHLLSMSIADLSTMEHKLETNQYASLRGFIDDAQLIFDNCRIYNPEGSVYAKAATKMEKFLKDQVAERLKSEA